MSSKTTNYNLHKIDLTDAPPDITVLNGNWDTIDNQLKSLSDNKASGTHGHSVATTTSDGFMSKDDKAKLSGLNNYTHPSYTARTGEPTMNQAPGFGTTFTISQVISDNTGHVTDMKDIEIFMPNDVATTSYQGLMSTAMVTKLNGIETGANKTVVDTAMSTSSTNPVQNKVVKAAIDGHTHNYAGSSSAGGAADSAKKLQTARTLTIGNAAKNFDGTGNLAWTLDEIGAANSANLRFKDFTHVSQIGLTIGSETLASIAQGMPDYSRLTISVNNNNNQSAYPHPYGMFRATKFDAYRIVFEFNGRVEGTTPGQYWIASATLDGSSYVVNGWYSIYGEHNKVTAANLQPGTFGGQMVANASAQAPDTKQIRNSKLMAASTFDGVTNWGSHITNGEIVWRYE